MTQKAREQTIGRELESWPLAVLKEVLINFEGKRMKDQHDHSKNSGNPQGKNVVSSLKRIHFEEIDSTNTWAKRHPQDWLSEGVTLVTAASQTAGRGRFNRLWASPPHLNLYATFCFWLDAERRDIGHLPQLLALACAKVLEKQGFAPKIKWPNDLLLDGKKVAGILCETIQEEKRRGIVCGIGLNVNMSQELLTPLNRPATSLWIEGGRTFEKEDILDMLAQTFIAFLDRFRKEGFAPFFSSFQSLFFYQPGQQVFFHHHQNGWEGWFETLHSDGSIELRLKGGIRKRFYAGEFVE